MKNIRMGWQAYQVVVFLNRRADARDNKRRIFGLLQFFFKMIVFRNAAGGNQDCSPVHWYAQRRSGLTPGASRFSADRRNGKRWRGGTADRFRLDVWYVENQSLWLDLKIITLTVWKILKREGINQPGQATMQEFTGSGS